MAGLASSVIVGAAAGSVAGPVGVAAGALGGFVENAAGMFIGSAGAALQSAINPSVSAAAVGTSGGSNSGVFNSGGYNFQARAFSPSARDIKTIDDFFTAFGYSKKQYRDLQGVMSSLPFKNNIGNGGQSFYIQTAGAIVIGSHKLAAEQMRNMLDGGIRFWKDEIGTAPAAKKGEKRHISFHDDEKYFAAREKREAELEEQREKDLKELRKQRRYVGI